ncbi:MAG: ATP-binding protein [bacterium]|nr:ATP-binding protein [bacterium]
MEKPHIVRQKYLEAAISQRNKDMVKIITGHMQCGKSTLLKDIGEHFREQSPNLEIICIDLDQGPDQIVTSAELSEHLHSRLDPNVPSCILIDEIQLVPGWQNVINTIHADYDCNIFATSSHALSVSDTLSTFLSGGYVEIKMLPLTFSEYLQFAGIELSEDGTMGIFEDRRPKAINQILEKYIKFGGLPAMSDVNITEQEHFDYFSSIVQPNLQRNIYEGTHEMLAHKISDPPLLKQVARYLAKAGGNAITSSSVAAELSESGMAISDKTAKAYIRFLCSLCLFYPSSRYDIHTNTILKSKKRYYIGDLGMRSFLCGYGESDDESAFKTAVCYQLLSEGYNVFSGKLYGNEIDFLALKGGQRLYVQACNEMLPGLEARMRQVAPLRAIRDNYEKIIVTRRGFYPSNIGGIKILTAQEFFLKHG